MSAGVGRVGAHRWVAMAVVCVVALAAYAPSFSVPFQFDDYARIVENERLRRGELAAGVAALGNSRLLPSATVALNYAVGEDDTCGYHIVNFLIHLLAAVAVFQLALALCRTPRLRDTWLGGQSTALATGAALLFACHPIQTQGVTYIIQRTASMATMFYVWSVVAYVNARNRSVFPSGLSSRPLYVACALLAVCAILSKENAVSLPLALMLTEWVFYGRRVRLRTVGLFALGALLLLAIPVAWKVLSWRPVGQLAATESRFDFAMQAVLAQGAAPFQKIGPIDYFLTQLTVLPRYLALVVLPWGLNVDHDIPLEHGMSPAVAGGFALLVALLVLGVYAARRWPLVGFGILWFFVALSVESSFLPITDVMMEHRVYLAMPGIALALASPFAWAFHRRPRAAAIVGVPVVALLAVLTFARNQVWQTPLSLWSDAASKSPNKARVHVNVGVAYHGLDRLDDAIRHYCRALEIDPNIALAEENLQIALDQQGRFEEIMGRLIAEAPSVKGVPEGAVLIELNTASVVCP